MCVCTVCTAPRRCALRHVHYTPRRHVHHLRRAHGFDWVAEEVVRRVRRLPLRCVPCVFVHVHCVPVTYSTAPQPPQVGSGGKGGGTLAVSPSCGASLFFCQSFSLARFFRHRLPFGRFVC